MSISAIARTLGRRGGLSRARRLSPERREEIARMGAGARAESFRLARAIRNNFEYLGAIDRLRPAVNVGSASTFSGLLPGIYDGDTQD